jgi:hypothetical protein
MHVEMADKLLEYLADQTEELQQLTQPLPRPPQEHTAFAH